MSTELLHRIQFGFTISFHFIFPPMSLGLGLLLIVFGVQAVRTDDPKWRQLAMFWTKIYGLIFSMGVATGLVQEFQFGTNWSEYS
ncbi:MAG: cytochrome ubiquinol oxidase subunit I, partial [Microthrixaceae bacterium]|nr:cytochrome ubiquinol oxidase subunit I [Microthrixaceae bacterium]